jgi:hypothetical protein
MRGGRLNDARFGRRMCGYGPRWEAIHALFDIHCRRHGLGAALPLAEGPDPPRATALQASLLPLMDGDP